MHHLEILSEKQRTYQSFIAVCSHSWNTLGSGKPLLSLSVGGTLEMATFNLLLVVEGTASTRTASRPRRDVSN